MKLFQNMRIKRKIIVMSLLIVIMSSIGGMCSVTAMELIRGEYEDALVNYGFAQGDIGKALAALTLTDGSVHNVVSYFDADSIQTAKDNVPAYEAEFEGHMATVNSSLQTNEEKTCYQNVMTAWEQYKVLAEEIMIHGTKSENSWVIKEAQLRLTGELDPVYDVIYDNLVDLMELKVEEGDAVQANAARRAGTSSVLVLCIIVFTIVVSLVLSAVLAGGISKPMQECSEHLKLFAKGDFKNAVPASDRRDEVGDMLNSLHTAQKTLGTVISDACGMLEIMSTGDFDVDSKVEDAYVGDLVTILTSIRTINRELSNALAQIALAAEQVAAGAGQVSTGAQDLAQGAAEQASAVEELSATITEIAVQARKNAESSESAIEDSRNAGAQVNESARYVSEMEQAMEQISDSSVEIAKIIATIENIAFQTNILALNAAVEAARAGTAGKGFAVVADEVRNLASKSDEAAKATKDLIERSVNAVKNGSDIMKHVTDSLDKTVAYTNQVVNTIGEINAAMEAEAEAITQVTNGIDQIAAVVQTNSATSEQSAAASEELSSQSDLMKRKLDGINLYKGGSENAHNTDVEPYEPADYENSYVAAGSYGDKY